MQRQVRRLERSDDQYERRAACERLGQLGPEARDAVPALITALQDDYLDVQKDAAIALGKIGPGPEDRNAVPALVKCLAEPAWDDRYYPDRYQAIVGRAQAAAVALGQIGSEARDAVPGLIRALGEWDEGRLHAAAALARIGKDAVPALIERLTDRNQDVRQAAARALGEIGPAARDAVPGLIGRLNDQEKEIRHAAAVALGLIGPEARNAVGALRRLEEEDPSREIRKAASNALEKIGH